VDGIVVEVRVLDREVEDRGIRSKPRDREIVDVVAQCSTGQEPSRDVVKPEALAKIVELLRRLNNFTLGEASSKRRQKRLALGPGWLRRHRQASQIHDRCEAGLDRGWHRLQEIRRFQADP
jgi:hypothetical protein